MNIQLESQSAKDYNKDQLSYQTAAIQTTDHLQSKQINDKAMNNTEMNNQINDQINDTSTLPPQVKPQTPIVHSISYRPDIDGLRAIAIIIVVIFHAYPQYLQGGFIGVDIFFVISGYLITKIIVKQQLKNKFSYRNFYSRRIRRIYPPLIVVLIFVLYITSLKLPKRNLQIATNTITASTLFGANIQILTAQKDYFDPDTKTNPVLHLWSLGVQQQFYIIWPLLITFIIKKFNNFKGLILLTAYLLVCFIANIVAAYRNLQFDFYFPFCRFWQMAIGGLIAYQNIKIQNYFIPHLLSLIGLVTILTTIWIVDEKSLFPGWWALLPTLASAFIIQSGQKGIVNKYLLSLKPMQFIGKISYSLYLWHWPLLVFSRLLYPHGSFSIFAQIPNVLLITLILSILSYFMIQRPIRKRRSRLIVFLLLMGMISIGVTSMLMHNNSDFFQLKLSQNQKKQFQQEMIPRQSDYYIKNGRNISNISKNRLRQPPTLIKWQLSKYVTDWSERFNQLLLQKRIDKSSKYYQDIPWFKKMTHYEVANQGKQNLLLIVGDSHGRYTAFRFGQLYRQAKKQNKLDTFPTIVAITFSGVTLLPFEQSYKYIHAWIQKFKPQRILFVCNWSGHWQLSRGGQGWLDGTGKCDEKYYRQNVDQFINWIQQIQKKNISTTITSFNPQGHQYNPYNMRDQTDFIKQNLKPIRLSQYQQKYRSKIDYLEKNITRVGGEIINFSDNQCYDDICQVLTPLGYCIFFDDDHFTTIAATHWLSVVDYLVQF